MEKRASWKDFVQLTKPGIIRSNLLAAFAGFWLASQWQVDWLLLVYTLLGTALVMACACVLNNYWDRDMDTKMERTQTRALPTGRINPTIVWVYGVLLGVVGMIVLYVLVHPLTALFGLIGIFDYVVVYTMWLKRTSTWSTSMGAISGAMPPVIGYCAVSPSVDSGAVLLFALLFLWQPPHFWALGIRRKEEYRAAGFPLLPVVKGVRRTKLQMLPYIVLLLPVGVLFYAEGYVTLPFLIASLLLSAYWLFHCLKGLKVQANELWAKRNFMFSIYYLMLTLICMMIFTERTL